MRFTRTVALQGVAILLITIVVVAAIVSTIYKRYKDLIAERVYLVRYRLAGVSGSTRSKKTKQSQLDKLRPKLAVIAKRIEAIDIDPKRKKDLIKVSKREDGDDKLQFDARGIFDALDTNNDGVLQYSELNAILALDDDELEVFVTSMNKATKAMTVEAAEEDSVSRPVFVNNFLKALEGTVNLNVTTSEAASIYDGILEENQAKEVEEKMLYTSVLSNFLSEYEIMLLIKVCGDIDCACCG